MAEPAVGAPGYTRHEWQPNEQVHPSQLNNIEEGVYAAHQILAAALSGDSGGGISGEPVALAHIADPTPHPVYDDIPDLSTTLTNGLT